MQYFKSDLVKQGWASKQGGLIPTWKRRWFVLNGKNLNYYEEQGGKRQGCIDLTKASNVSLAPDCRHQPAFQVTIPGERTYFIVPETKEEAEDWVKVIDMAIHGPKVVETPKLSFDTFDQISSLIRCPYGKIALARNKSDGKVYALKKYNRSILRLYDRNDLSGSLLSSSPIPFVNTAIGSIQSNSKFAHILEFCPGGPLSSRIEADGKFSVGRAQLYSAEIAIGLAQINSKGFIFKELRPESILIDSYGHLKITDLGLTRKDCQDDGPFMGNNEYAAPEIIMNKKATEKAVWWSFGVILLQMLAGKREKMCEITEAADLISKLSDPNPQTRPGFDAIKHHPFFSKLKWEDVESKSIKPEWVPCPKKDDDCQFYRT